MAIRGEDMEVTIKGEPNEIAALMRETQRRQEPAATVELMLDKTPLGTIVYEHFGAKD